ncbi:speckle-type POZ protein-like B [Stegodyphus dumicola]|uniref:speckle-type POZ protein-like B n=1 Tax=Stegodyphus dumicola TaxID=202533 RepID=UPI0015B2A362|nr:speckle-type POZ protein-like B [Stegodyphus dumicola]
MEKDGDGGFKFTWCIENFSMCHQPNGQCLRSSRFTLNTLPNIKCCIKLYPRGISDRDYIDVIINLDGDVPEKCAIQSRIQGLTCTGILIFTYDEMINYFSVERQRLLDMLIEDVLVVKCTLEAVYETNDEFPQLSYQNGLFPDLVLRAGDHIFNVHKSVLLARWPKLVEKFDAEATCEVFLDIRPTILEAMIEYVYTGKLNFKEQELLAEVYAAAAKYNLTSIERSPVVEQEVWSHFNGEEVSFDWIIEDFITFPVSTILHSRVFSVALQRSCTWHLILHIREITDDSRIFDIYLCKVHDSASRPIFVRSKISLTRHSLENEYLFSADECWRCAEQLLLISKRLFLGCIFELKCEFKFSDCKYISEVTKTSCAFPSSVNCLYFKSDLRNLYRSGNLSDINITVGSKTFWAHKYILCSRSSVFRKMFETSEITPKMDTVTVSDIDPDIMDEILLFMYSGCLEKPLKETVEQLYIAAYRFDVSTLKEKCSSFLKANLNAENAGKILQLAEEHSDCDLQKCALRVTFGYGKKSANRKKRTGRKR